MYILSSRHHLLLIAWIWACRRKHTSGSCGIGWRRPNCKYPPISSRVHTWAATGSYSFETATDLVKVALIWKSRIWSPANYPTVLMRMDWVKSKSSLSHLLEFKAAICSRISIWTVLGRIRRRLGIMTESASGYWEHSRCWHCKLWWWDRARCSSIKSLPVWTRWLAWLWASNLGGLGQRKTIWIYRAHTWACSLIIGLSLGHKVRHAPLIWNAMMIV